MLCVYCSKSNDFNDEHVFPASLGGDDNGFILRCVCKSCNSKFSKLEEELARRSPVALARNFNPHPGRRGKKDDATFLPVAAYINDGESGLSLETSVGARLSPSLYPQIIVDGNAVHITAGSVEGLDTFVADIKALIGAHDFQVVEKVRPDLFNVYAVTRDKGQFSVGPPEQRNKSVSPAIWASSTVVEADTPEAKARGVIHPRFYRHKSGSINFKSDDLGTLGENLEKVWSFLNAPNSFDNYRDVVIDGPLAKVESSFEPAMAARAIAKIGFNFLVRAAGYVYACDSAFDGLKKSILEGVPPLPYDGVLREDADEWLGRVVDGTHVVMLYSLSMGVGRAKIYAAIRFYGVITHLATLSLDAPAPAWKYPLYFLVNYQERVINQIDAIEYMKTYCLPLGITR